MGFRDLFYFNLVILGRQGWRILSDSSAFLSRILKAKQFPRRDFLHENQGLISTLYGKVYCRRKSYYNQELDGTRDEPLVDGLEDLSVSSLLSHNSTRNVSLIIELLLPSDIEVVVRTALFVLHCEDKRI